MSRVAFPLLASGTTNHPKPSDTVFQYGTAGFRTKADQLESVMFRMGLLAVLRARKVGRIIGVMVTASHNPVVDNGVKLVDPMGEMLPQGWEGYASRIANVEDGELPETIDNLCKEESIRNEASVVGTVYVGRDTRPSGEHLCMALRDGVSALSGHLIDCGVVTTPQLHYAVRTDNLHEVEGMAGVESYNWKMATAFRQLVGDIEPLTPLGVDCANGVGGPQLLQLADMLLPNLQIDARNVPGHGGTLNYQVGSDYVKVEKKAPQNFDSTIERGRRFAVFDGDADRLVYFYFRDDGSLGLLDGDKISILVSTYFRQLLAPLHPHYTYTMGVIQTAYANGAATRYVREVLGVEAPFTPTGVKHLHHKATEYDIGIYFEANGHGTVLFSPRFMEDRGRWASLPHLSKEGKKSVRKLYALTELINQAVGDAISDMLLVEAILGNMGWTVYQWDAMYEDLPNKLAKVSVKSRSVITTTDAETRAVTPVGLQDRIDALAQATPQGRSFVRPSGTEDVVRVYAEAATQETAITLARDVARVVFEMAGGVGDTP